MSGAFCRSSRLSFKARKAMRDAELEAQIAEAEERAAAANARIAAAKKAREEN